MDVTAEKSAEMGPAEEIEAGVHVHVVVVELVGVDKMAMDKQVCDVELWTLLRVFDSRHSHGQPKMGVEVDVVVAVECMSVAS